MSLIERTGNITRQFLILAVLAGAMCLLQCSNSDPSLLNCAPQITTCRFSGWPLVAWQSSASPLALEIDKIQPAILFFDLVVGAILLSLSFVGLRTVTLRSTTTFTTQQLISWTGGFAVLALYFSANHRILPKTSSSLFPYIYMRNDLDILDRPIWQNALAGAFLFISFSTLFLMIQRSWQGKRDITMC